MRRRLHILDRLTHFIAIITVIGLASGCTDPVMQQMERVKQGVCDCKTVACADQWLNKVPSTLPSTISKAQALAQQTLACYSKISSDTAVDAELPTADAK